MSEPIIDSSILIDCLRGRANAVALISDRSAKGKLQTHLFVAAELMTGARDKSEMAQIDSFLKSFELILPTEADGLSALDLYRRFHLSHGVDWPDCQLAATAIRLGVEVLTQNLKHFKAFPGLVAVRPS